jgi:hypothetical protein
MRLGGGATASHLTYCTNIHPGESWAEVKKNLERKVTTVKQQVSPDRPFGVGLRLSAVAAETLRGEEAFNELLGILDANDMYVFTINGFPYGPFHGTRVKEEVYLPDWRDPVRLQYTNVLADLLDVLLPDEEGLCGSISTVPGAFKQNATGEDEVMRIAAQLVDHAAYLVKLRERSGKTIALALEPEPCCFLETIEESVAFFDQHLFAAQSVDRLASSTGLAKGDAEEALRRHLGLCYDLCHGAVEFEDAESSLDRLRDVGISISKLQISAGLRLPEVTPNSIEALRQFDDSVYLHQVVEKTKGGLNRFVDLPDAFNSLSNSLENREWRVHFHVPIFHDKLATFSTTRPFIESMLALHREQPLSQHLEVETYTWDVLPAQFRDEAVETAVARELSWVMDELTQ